MILLSYIGGKLSVGPWDLLLEKHIYIFFIPLSVGPWDSLVGEACERQCSPDMLVDSMLFCYAMLSVGPWDSLVGEACQRTTLLYRG